jgi:hypothetical protein
VTGGSGSGGGERSQVVGWEVGSEVLTIGSQARTTCTTTINLLKVLLSTTPDGTLRARADLRAVRGQLDCGRL